MEFWALNEHTQKKRTKTPGFLFYKASKQDCPPYTQDKATSERKNKKNMSGIYEVFTFFFSDSMITSLKEHTRGTHTDSGKDL